MLIENISLVVYGAFCVATGKYMMRREERKQKESESENVDNSNSRENYKDFFISL